MAGALLASAIMTALKLEDYENQYDKERGENAAKMEQIACLLIQEYNKVSEQSAYHALLHDVKALGDRNCVDLARSARAIKFATQAAFQSFVETLWYGGIEGPTNRLAYIWASLLVLPIPIFLWFTLEIEDVHKEFEIMVG